MSIWQVQEAKARFSELLRDAKSKPQAISIRGRIAAVVISTEEYERLRKPQRSLVDFLRESPLAGMDLEIERDRSPARDVDL